jgi:sugar lactone lactonase YvrE
MVRKGLLGLLFVLVVLALYFLAWPVPVEPVAWKAPPNPGYAGLFARSDLLKAVEFLKIGANHGPEDVALDDQGRIYVSTHEGFIVRLQPDGMKPGNWVDTKGRPLGIDFDRAGNLIVADGVRGLLSVSPEGKVVELATVADGVPIRFADDVDCAADGKIYFSDASTKFGVKESGGTMEGSLLEIMEHGGHGRLLVYDPATRRTSTLLKGLTFANGVAVSHDQTCVLINDTGNYRVMRYWIAGPNRGKSEPVIENLPGFPDNISTGLEGRYWVALVSPRNPLVDDLSEKPFVRKLIQRFPAFIRPKAAAYGHILAIDGNGKVLKDLQDPNTSYPQNTSVTETREFLYIGSLVSPVLAYVAKSKVGL